MFRLLFGNTSKLCMISLLLPLCIAGNANSIELDYSILTTSHQSVEVSVSSQLLNTDTLNLYRIVADDQTALPPIASIQVVDSQGNPLVHTITFLQLGQYILEKLSITTSNKSNALVTYSLNMLPQNYWYADVDSIIVAENQILFQPLPDETEITKMAFSFSVQNNWRVVTRLNPDNTYYTANLSDTFQIVLNHWRPIILGQPLAFGEFDILENKSGNIRAIAAYPSGDADYATDAAYVETIFEYQKTIMGDPSLGLGDTAFLYIFHPYSNLHNIPTIGARGTFEIDHTNENRHLGHEMYHMWQGCGNSLPDSWRFIKIPCWWMEGGNEFLGVSAHLATGAFTLEKEMFWRVHFFNEYKNLLLDTSNDWPITDCGSLLPETGLFIACQYAKSHSVIWLLEELLKDLTMNQRTVEGFVGFLFNNYSLNLDFLDSQGLREALNLFSGFNFRPFFNLYVFGTEPLPLQVQNNELTVLWDQLPDQFVSSDYDDDNDVDGLDLAAYILNSGRISLESFTSNFGR